MSIRSASIAAGIFFALPAFGQVVNGGFEAPGTGFRNVLSGQTWGNWTNAGPSNIEFVNAIVTPSLPGLEASAYEGQYWIDLVGTGAPSSIYQDLVTIPGSQYEVSFAFAGNVWGGSQIMNMSTLWNGSVQGSYQHNTAGHTGFDMGWTVHSFVVTGTGLDRLMFRATSGSNAAGPALDDVRIQLIPSPASISLLAAAALFTVRRRR